MGKETNRLAGRKTSGQAMSGSQGGRQTCRQSGRHAERHTDNIASFEPAVGRLQKLVFIIKGRGLKFLVLVAL